MFDLGMKMSSLDKNIEELEARGALTMQLLLLVIMGMFLSLHIALSFAWGGLISILSGERWISVSLLYLQSWEFSRFSVGVPFVVFSSAFILIYVASRNARPYDIGEQVYRIIERDFAHGKDFQLEEALPSHWISTSMNQLAKKAKIKIPRLFCCSLPIYNAFAISGRNGDNAIVLFAPMLAPPLIQLKDAVIAHELGHIINKDSKRTHFVLCAINAFGLLFKAGQNFYQVKTRECIIDRKTNEPFFISILNAILFFVLGLLMMVVGWIPWSWAQGILWWRRYTAEYLADAVGGKLLDDHKMMSDMLIVLHVMFHGTSEDGKVLSVRDDGVTFKVDEHPADIGRVRRLLPDFKGDWEAAARDVMRRRRISC